MSLEKIPGGSDRHPLSVGLFLCSRADRRLCEIRPGNFPAKYSADEIGTIEATRPCCLWKSPINAQKRESCVGTQIKLQHLRDRI